MISRCKFVHDLTCEQVSGRITELEDENAKLSTQLTDATESMGRVEERCAKLRAERDEWHRVAVSKQDIIDHMRDSRCENAKLREAVSDWRDFAVGGADSLPDWNTIEADLESRMRELGIEVE